MTHKVVKTLRSRDLLRFVTVKKFFKGWRPMTSTKLTPQHFSPNEYHPYIRGNLTNEHVDVGY